MIKKKVEITHIRISKEDSEKIDELRYPRETYREFVTRLLKDYGKRGVPREIVRIIEELQHTATRYVHEDFHAGLELVKAVLLKAHNEDNSLERSKIAQKLIVACEDILDPQKKEGKEIKNVE